MVDIEKLKRIRDIDALIVALHDESKYIRSGAAYVLGELQDNKAIKSLEEASKDKEKIVRINAINSLEKFGIFKSIVDSISTPTKNDTIFNDVDFENKVLAKEKLILKPSNIQIQRGYSCLPNNNIKFGIKVTNYTDYLIAEIDVLIDFSEELFSIKGQKIYRLGNLFPKSSKTSEFIFKPLGCIHKEEIGADIFFKDHIGKKQTLHMRPKEVHCVCPFLKEKPLSEGEYSRLATSSEFVQEGISFKGISVDDLAKFMGETCKHTLHNVREYDFEGKKVIYLSGESVGEKAYYLLTAVIQEYKGLTQVVLRAHSDKKYGLNGFMNEMADSLRHLVESVQNAKEIGIIENTQVINIIDSVVQRTNFNMGDGGNAKVNIKDSVVQRSKIGTEE